MPTEVPLPPTYVSDPSYAGDVPLDQEAFLPNGTKRYLVTEQLLSPENNFMLEADELYLTPGLVALFQLYAEEAQSTAQTYLDFMNIFIPL